MYNDNLCGPPLTSCRESTRQEKKQLSNTAAAGIVVAIVFSATVICLYLIYLMLRIWCKWKQASISSDDNGGGEKAGKEEKWGDRVIRSDEYWDLNKMTMLPCERSGKDVSSMTTCIFHHSMSRENSMRSLV
ncbi:hypothetical protein HanHA300_Chr09g0337391 [Helianthus annuus]|nr:hypothetical protein HanHA300_Chr09g0337391 [Helianthus annuus]